MNFTPEGKFSGVDTIETCGPNNYYDFNDEKKRAIKSRTFSWMRLSKSYLADMAVIVENYVGHNKDDLLVDLKMIEEDQAESRFIWFVRSSGTHLLFLHSKDVPTFIEHHKKHCSNNHQIYMLDESKQRIVPISHDVARKEWERHNNLCA